MGLISIFDDEHYSNSDYDILGPTVRADIRRVLIADGWKASGSKVFTKVDYTIKFPAPSHTLGCNPADKVVESIEGGGFCIVTPTQALLVAVLLREWDLENAKALVLHHPANLSKIWNWILNEKSVHVPRSDIAALKVVQKQGFELRKLGEQNLYPFKKL